MLSRVYLALAMGFLVNQVIYDLDLSHMYDCSSPGIEATNPDTNSNPNSEPNPKS